MSQEKVEFVIVPGSFATPGPYDVLVKALNAKGYSARVVGLPSVNDGTRLPAATMEDDAAEIRSAVLSILDDPEKPKNVVLAAHSYGGFPTTESAKGLAKADRAAQGKQTAVIGLMYLGAFLPQQGQSLRDIMSNTEGFTEEFRVGYPGGYFPRTAPEFAPYIFNDVEDPAEAARLLATMARHSSDSYSGKVTYAAWKDIPSVTVIPSIDLIIPVAVQEDMFEKANAVAPGNVKKLSYEGAGHCFFWTRPDATVAYLIKLAEENL
jgi:pimeloyl-ACP methyl ester carboxylesterase